ncbi:MAG: acetate--CoA ligase family protein [Burkholderiales bacterium]|nr:acetate--CoA ligase family protein [Burkholderiales bacterium]
MTHALHSVLDPKSVVVIGASENPDKIGGRPLFYLRRHGYRGKVFGVNPKRTETQGFPTFPSLDALPEAPEVAIVVVPGDAAVQAVADCARHGVKVCVTMASGFGETGTTEGIAAERLMVDTARAAGMRMVGPNTQGLANFGTGAILSFSSMFIESQPMDGPVGVVSQSGAMSVVPYGMLRARGIGVRYAHATGNDADVNVAEIAAVVAEDPDLKLLLLYLESIPDPAPLAEAARVAHARGLPIVALKSGRTAAGQQAAKSHTGALANEDRLVDAFLERHGIWRARDLQELVAATELYLKGWKPKGRRLVAISNSGAVCVMAADAATRLGMPMAQLAPETRADLNRVLPSFATTTNPIDITAALLTNSRLFGDILPALARDPAADAFLIGIPVAGAAYDVDAFARDTATFAESTGKPTMAGIPQPQIAAPFKALGIPVMETETEAVAALAQFVAHHERMAQTKPTAAARPAPIAASRMLNEAESLGLAARAGIPVVPHRLCATADEAVQALLELGAPVVVKGCSRAVAHKSELGLVRLRLQTEAEVRAAFSNLQRTLQSRNFAFDGVIVARMASGLRELMIGAHVDAVFGPVVLIGDGGKFVEALPDSQVLLPPFDTADVHRALSRLRIAPLLAGVRDEPPLDVDAFAAATVAVGALMQGTAPRIASLDLNPVLVGARGEGCVALDAVVFVAD